jgi:hypothetical protein
LCNKLVKETIIILCSVYFLFFKIFIEFGREKQCMTSSNMYIYTYLLFYDALLEAKFMQQKYLELRTYMLHKIHYET